MFFYEKHCPCLISNFYYSGNLNDNIFECFPPCVISELFTSFLISKTSYFMS